VSIQNLNLLTYWLHASVRKTAYCYTETDTYQGGRKKKWKVGERKYAMKETNKEIDKKEQISVHRVEKLETKELNKKEK
jgi:hypothetical protein